MGAVLPAIRPSQRKAKARGRRVSLPRYGFGGVPSVTAVLKVTEYDSSTGTGDESLTEYFGGSCNGAVFVPNGATQVDTGTLHFVISDNGNRIDSIVTSLQISGLGGFSLSFTELQQQSPENWR
jgi:hypothetical protein